MIKTWNRILSYAPFLHFIIVHNKRFVQTQKENSFSTIAPYTIDKNDNRNTENCLIEMFKRHLNINHVIYRHKRPEEDPH